MEESNCFKPLRLQSENRLEKFSPEIFLLTRPHQKKIQKFRFADFRSESFKHRKILETVNQVLCRDGRLIAIDSLLSTMGRFPAANFKYRRTADGTLPLYNLANIMP